MKITVDIPKNDYVQPTEVRPEVVQYICEAFLSNNIWNIFHPESQGEYWSRTLYVIVDKRSRKAYGFGGSKPFTVYDKSIRFYGCEMKAAFKALREAGYHMYRVYGYNSWMGYVCNRKPFNQDGEEITTFNDFID